MLIDYIEPSGLFNQDLSELSSFSGFHLSEIQKVLKKMQNFEPSGVFATNLKECLLLQLQNNDNLSNSKKIIVENLELLGEGNLRELKN